MAYMTYKSRIFVVAYKLLLFTFKYVKCSFATYLLVGFLNDLLKSDYSLITNAKFQFNHVTVFNTY